MPDEQKPAETVVQTPAPVQQPVTKKSIDELPPEFAWVKAELTDVRKEAGDSRTKLKTIEEEELKKKGDYETLVGQLKPKADLADKYEGALKATNDLRIAALPENIRAIVPGNYDPVDLSKWLDSAALVVPAKPAIPNLNPGASSTQSADNSADLTPSEKLMADRTGTDYATYAASKKGKGKPPVKK